MITELYAVVEIPAGGVKTTAVASPSYAVVAVPVAVKGQFEFPFPLMVTVGYQFVPPSGLISTIAVSDDSIPVPKALPKAPNLKLNCALEVMVVLISEDVIVAVPLVKQKH